MVAPTSFPDAAPDAESRAGAGADRSAAALPLWRRLLPRLLIGATFGALVLSGLAIFADVRDLGQALRDFEWWLAVPVLLLTCFNYGLRFVKWELYLRQLQLPRPPVLTNLLVYLSAFSMSVSPGKIGEVIKAIVLKRLTGAPISKTTAIIAAERLTDGLAMLLLAGIGLIEFSYGRTALGLAAVGAVVAAILLQRPGFAAWAMRNAGRLPVVGRLAVHAGGFFEASNALFRPGPTAFMVLLGIISWAGECVAFYLVLIGLGLEPSGHLLLVATFVLAVSSVFGALSMLPGGLGVAEASVTGLLLLLLPDDEISRSTAVAATLLIRFATLWFAVLLGFGSLAMLYRRFARAERAGLTTDPAEPGIQASRAIDKVAG